MIRTLSTKIILLVLMSILMLSSTQAKDSKITEQEAYEIGLEAYQYFYPIVLMDITRKVLTNYPEGGAKGNGPVNMFHHIRKFPDARFREVVRPNFDTLYSSAWLDLTEEPQIVSAADTNGRHYLLPMLDMWTNVFAVPGKRTDGTNAKAYVIVPPGWKGDIPKGVERIEAPTPYVWILGRTQSYGPSDYQATHKIQDGYRITPLSQWGKNPTKTKSDAAKVDPCVDMETPPLEQLYRMPPIEFFKYAVELVKMHPRQLTDWSVTTRMKRLGIDHNSITSSIIHSSPEVQAGLMRAKEDRFRIMKEGFSRIAPVENGWLIDRSSIGVYGNNYLKRAIVALEGLGANQPEDAIYPQSIHDDEGNPLVGGARYEIRFPKGELPPNNAFWSITMYDGDGFPIANPIDRFSLGSRNPLVTNEDGSTTIYIQPTSPGKEKESNWLPSTDKGKISPTMRIYAPSAKVMDGTWSPPAIHRVK